MARKTASQCPMLGIFWLLDDKIISDSVPLSKSETYGDHLTHPRGHVDVWEQWQRERRVPVDMPYEEPPRGRVTFNRKTGSFLLLADRCILGSKTAVAEIKRIFCLPTKVSLDTDPHYRCHECLYGNLEDEDDD